MADNQIDTGDLMECLVANKHQKEMNEKCTVGVTHFQLVRLSITRSLSSFPTLLLWQPSVSPPQIQMKDFRFSYKFKMACKEDVLKLCPNIKKK